ncbi:hypothetical protein EDC94DRAFT_659920 [Helicostylum pulchrum]|nr:hypothetical protein EDC94DRAFT_659920 [Helicostylum pulchrum]
MSDESSDNSVLVVIDITTATIIVISAPRIGKDRRVPDHHRSSLYIRGDRQ